MVWIVYALIRHGVMGGGVVTPSNAFLILHR